MIEANLYNPDGTVAGKSKLSEGLFGRKWNANLVHQVLTAMDANRRKPFAHAKGRGEVRGGGRKPWRQKGTGRARHGSIRSPIWKGGGVTHGPLKVRNYEQKINKKMRRAALAAVLSRKHTEGELKVVTSFGIEQPKTRELAKALSALIGKQPHALLVPAEQTVYRAAANIPRVSALAPNSLNIRDILKHRWLLVEQGALTVIEKTYS